MAAAVDVAPAHQSHASSSSLELEDATEHTHDSPAWSVQMLVEKGVKDVPSRYVRHSSLHSDLPVIEDYSVELPVIDYGKMQGEHGDEETAKFFKALDDWGFLQLVNHGLTEGLIDRTLDVARNFFQLPVSEKQKYFAPDPNVPVEGYARINIVDGLMDWGDTMMMNGDVLVLCKDKTDCSDWNHLPEMFRDTMATYARETHTLGLKMMKLMGDAIGMADVEETGGPQGLQLAFNFYPPCPQPELVLGISAHTDPQTFSFLIQDQPGLHVLNNGRWVLARPIPDALIVNIGDQLEILSNGKYKSIMHRVRVSSEYKRFIVGSFLRPSLDAVIGPDPKIIDDEHPSLYKPIKYGDYMGDGIDYGFLEKRIVNKVMIQA
ncbi:hypothetical protein O6H91_05G025500 [Diphasiastrum complanatum]|uniref:Uncharacterized protein n=1 Tax=Diphasiastrum complanatum TaxID=34168 RepID=A0ACC2DLV2_DIPCM|nr:hypothetical protein O6H91_05G025500 [Diphasiastrum complanatum]